MGHVNGNSIIGEIAASGLLRGHRIVVDGSAGTSQPFIAAEEECLVLKNPATGCGAELIVAKRWFLSTRAAEYIGKVVLRIQRIVPQEIVS